MSFFFNPEFIYKKQYILNALLLTWVISIYPMEKELTLYKDHSLIDDHHNVVHAFLNEPFAYRILTNRLPNDVKRLLAQKALAQIPLLPWLAKKHDPQASKLTYANFFDLVESGIRKLYDSSWTPDGTRVRLRKDGAEIGIYDVVKKRIDRLSLHKVSGEHFAAVSILDNNEVSMCKQHNGPERWIWCDQERRYQHNRNESDDFDIKQFRYAWVNVIDGCIVVRNEWVDAQDPANNLRIPLDGLNVRDIYLRSSIKCEMDQAKEKIMTYDHDSVYVWFLNDFYHDLQLFIWNYSCSEELLLEKYIHNAHFDSSGKQLHVVYSLLNNKGLVIQNILDVYDLLSQTRVKRLKIDQRHFRDFRYSDSGLAIFLLLSDTISIGLTREKKLIEICNIKSSYFYDHLSVDPFGHKILADLGNSCAIYNLDQLHEIMDFFNKKILLEHVLLLNCIRWAHASGIKKFDFRKFPHLIKYYDTLPAVIKNITNKLVIR